MRLANGKFYRRFTSMEAIARERASSWVICRWENSKPCGQRRRSAFASQADALTLVVLIASAPTLDWMRHSAGRRRVAMRCPK